MIRRQLKHQFIGTAGGWLWLYARPLALCGAYLAMFSILFPGRSAPAGVAHDMPLFLLSGLLPWLSFADGLNHGMASLTQNAAMLRRTAFPPELFTAQAVAVSAITFAPVLLLIALWIGYRAGFDAAMLWSLPWFIGQILLAYSLGLASAVLAAAVRDIAQLITLYTSVGLFAAPIFFPIANVPSLYAGLMWANPVTPWIMAHRAALLDHSLPQPLVLGAMCAWLVFALLFGALLLSRSRDRLVDWL